MTAKYVTLLGLVMISWGLWLVHPVVFWIALGVYLIFVGRYAEDDEEIKNGN